VSELYFVRIRGRVQGPFDLEKLQQMVRRGRLSRIHELSSDRKSWCSAAENPELFSGSSASNAALPGILDGSGLPAVVESSVAPPTQPLLPEGIPRARADLGQRPDFLLLVCAIGGLAVLGVTVGVIILSRSADKRPSDAVPASAASPLESKPNPAGQQARDQPAIKPTTDQPVQPGATKAGASKPGAVGGYVDARTPADDLADSLGLVVVGFLIRSPQGKITEKIAFKLGGIAVAGGSGTAFVISHDGHLLTNRHVIQGAVDWRNARLAQKQAVRRGWEIEARIWVFVRDVKFVARLVHSSKRFDMALLKVSHRFGRAFRLSRRARPARDTAVRALGYPGAANLAMSASELALDNVRKRSATRIEQYFKARYRVFVLTRGTVSRGFTNPAGAWVQHGAQLHGGNSGGPLIDQEGVVVGINTKVNKQAAGISMSLSMPQLMSEIKQFTDKVRWVDQ